MGWIWMKSLTSTRCCQEEGSNEHPPMQDDFHACCQSCPQDRCFKDGTTFLTRYHKGDKVFYVTPLNWKGVEEFLDSYVDS